jgi:hypothetical protein
MGIWRLTAKPFSLPSAGRSPNPPSTHPGIRGRSSAGRALRSQCRGQGFDPPRLHLVQPKNLGDSLSGRFHVPRMRRELVFNGCGLRTEAPWARAHRTRLAAGDLRPSPWLRRVPWTRSYRPAGSGIAICRSTPREVVHVRRTVSRTSKSFTASRRGVRRVLACRAEPRASGRSLRANHSFRNGLANDQASGVEVDVDPTKADELAVAETRA